MIALQDKYDELIHHSKDIWAESAAGGFSKKKIDLGASSNPFIKSPEKPVSKKDSGVGIGMSSTTMSSVKKTLVKLHSMPNTDIKGG